MSRTSNIWWYNDVHFAGFHSVSSLKQPPAGGHVAQIWHIPSQPVFAVVLPLKDESLVHRYMDREVSNINFMVFNLARPGLSSPIYHTRCEHTNHNIMMRFPSLSLRVECTFFCNLQSRSRTNAVLVIGLYELHWANRAPLWFGLRIKMILEDT
jgi:hypothetical protein